MSYSQQQVVYHADQNTVNNLRAIRDHVGYICRQYTNQVVRIETIDGHVYTGHIVGCDRGVIHIAVPHHHHAYPYGTSPGAPREFDDRAFYNDTILTLVLYELLVIALLST